MADGLGNLNPLKCLGTDGMVYSASFQTNAAANPLSSTFRAPPGLVFTVAYAATGIYTVTLDASLKLPALPFVVRATPQYATLATDWFECGVVGEFNLTTGAFVVQAHRNGVANAPAATAGNRINFEISFRNSTSR